MHSIIAEKEIEMKKKEGRSSTSLCVREGVPFLVFQTLMETGIVNHGFSTRLGGVSKEHLSSMNLSFARGDKAEHVRENYQRIGRAIGFSCENLVFSDQTHTVNVRVVTEEDRGKGFVIPRDYTDTDGLITNVPGLVLATFYADCVPLFLVDPVHKAIGLSHSGWKGTVGKIGRKTVELMGETYGTRSEDLIAAIGPSICQDCYEVSEDVIRQFQDVFEKKYWKDIFYPKTDGKYQLNLWRANELILQEAGVQKEKIATTDICTCCNPELLFSHRASKGMRGNLGAFLMLKEGKEK